MAGPNIAATPFVGTAVSECTFRLLGVDVKCYVMADGSRIIGAESFFELLTAMEDGSLDVGDIEDFERWRRGQP